MPIDFQLTGVEIQSFRGLHSINIDFPQDCLNVLIGANNSGKSTILDAIALALEGPSSYNYTPEKYDYHHFPDGGCAKEFRIALRFDAEDETRLPAVRGGFGDPIPVHGVCVTGSIEKKRYVHKTRLVDQNAEPILLKSAIPLKGDAKQKWKDHHLSYPQRYARWQDINDQKPDVWLLKPSNLFVSLYQWKTGPLQRLASLLSRRFLDSKWEFTYKGKAQPMPDALHKVHEFFSSALHEFPFWRDDLKPRLEGTLAQYVGRQAAFDLKPDIRAIEEWLTEQLALSLAADMGGVTTPLEKMGDGWQSLVRIAALDVLSQYPAEVDRRVVLLFEEPESFLHPHLSRKLRGVLERLSAAGWLVVVSTHSPNFVSFSSNQHIIRLTRTANMVKTCGLQTSTVGDAPKLQERIDERGAHEMLFAQKAVLVEGQDDAFALRSYLRQRFDVDLDGRSISIIRAGDVGSLPTFASIASSLGIPWCAVSDEDLQPDGIVKQGTAYARKKLTNLQTPGDRQTTWKGDLETCLKKPQGKADPAWQTQHIEPKSTTTLQAEYPDFVTACEDVRAWAAAPPQPSA